MPAGCDRTAGAWWRQELRTIGPAVAIFASVGVLVAAWAAAGVTALLIDRGLRLVPARWFLPGAALLSALMAFATGTSWGTVATAGVALMGVARGLGVDPALAAGALVAGSHFGDKLSPLSETAALASAVAGTDLYTHIRHTAWTTVPAFLAALAVYALLGGAPAAPAAAVGAELEQALHAHFRLEPVLWLPPAIVLAAALLRWPVVPSLLASAAVALGLAVWVQGLSPAALPALVWAGYRPATGDPVLDRLLTQGGIAAMARVAAAAVALFGLVVLLLRTAPGRRLLDLPGRAATTRFRAVALAVGLAAGIMLLSGSSYLAILVTGTLLRDRFRRLGLAGENLSRTLEDSGTMVAPLVPWGVSGLYMAATLGVPTLQYLPWAIPNYLGLVLALLCGYTGWAIRARGDTPVDSLPTRA